MKLYIAVAIFFLTSCSQKPEEVKDAEVSKPKFSLLPSSKTGIDFVNKMVDSDEVMLTFEHRFNGGGVAIGDINNDGLDDIFFTASNLDNKLYLNKGDLVFSDISKGAGILPREGISTGVTMIDINCDGFLDIYVCRTGKFPINERKNLLYINNGDLTFKESAALYGLDDTGYSNQSTFFDFDNDGDLDMYLVNQPIEYTYANTILLQNDTARAFVSDRLYRNEGNGKFTEITKKAGVLNKAFGFNAAIEDFNEDGFWDVYVTNDYLQPDYLYINNKNGTFTESLSKYMKHCSNSSMGSVIADYNNDGHPDVLVLDMIAEDNARQKLLRGPMDYDDFYLTAENGAYYQYMRNQLQLNNGNGTFSEIGELAGISQTDWSWGPIMADLDNDGWKDIFISNGYRRDLTNMDYVTYFLDSINKIGGIGIFKSMSEMLNSLPETPIHNYAFRNNGDLTFKDVSKEWGFDALTFSNGSSCADLDNDGDLDIVINNIDQQAMIYRNDFLNEKKANSISVELKGAGCNTKGVGAKVIIHSAGKLQEQTYFPTQGYFSALPNKLHFGIGSDTKIDSLEIIWPGSLRQILTEVKSGEKIIADINNATNYVKEVPEAKIKMFADVTTSSGLSYTYKENEFVDYKREPLLPMKFSESGPCMSKGDVNNDGLEDIYIGGAKGYPGVIYIQSTEGKFKKISTEAFEQDKNYEDGGALFFDYDNDGDQDLYVASGGNEWDPKDENYQDRIYINNGGGSFKRAAADILPDMKFSTVCPAAVDFDGDGDMDLFVGGRIVSWNYPLSPRSFLLINENGKFVDATQSLSPQLALPGLICDALWTDFNNDKQPDLVVAGQWMAPAFYKNVNGKLERVDDPVLNANSGWWNCVVAGDFDKDGDIDYVFGNRGLNSRIKATQKEPARVYAGDFDQNGTLDAIATRYIQGVSYPIPLRDQLTDQIRPFKKKYLRYRDYANVKIEDIFSPEQLKSAYVGEATNFASCYIKNLGNGKFDVVELPLEVQFSSVNDFIADDFNDDGNTDLLYAGNNYAIDVETGRYDASIGGLLLGDGKGSFKYVNPVEHGFLADGNVRSMIYLMQKSGNFIMLGRNSEPVKVIKFRSKPTL